MNICIIPTNKTTVEVIPKRIIWQIKFKTNTLRVWPPTDHNMVSLRCRLCALDKLTYARPIAYKITNFTLSRIVCRQKIAVMCFNTDLQ